MQNISYHLTHLTLTAADQGRMRSFYRDVLGLIETPVTETQYTYQFTTQDAPFLTLNFTGQPTTEQHSGLYHFALLFPNASALASVVARLLSYNFPLNGGDHDVSEAIYLNDPDGNGIELYHDRPTQTWEWDNHLVKMGTSDVDIVGLLEQRPAQWQGFPSGVMIGHVHFVGRKVAEGDAFFIEQLQQDLTANLGNQAHFYSHNHYHHHHAFNTWYGPHVTPRAVTDPGLADWTVMVDAAYFTQLQTTLADKLSKTTPTELHLPDPFGGTLIVQKQPKAPWFKRLFHI